MRALLDARLGPKPTGIGFYVLNLSRELGALAPTEVTPVVRRRQRRQYRSWGLEPWSFPFRADGDAGRLPPADVVHGTNFHAMQHPAAQRVATMHDFGFLRFPGTHPKGMPERLNAIIQRTLPTTAVFVCDSASTKEEMLEYYDVEPERCVVVHLGVDESFLAAPDAEAVAATAARLKLESPYVLHVGAMIPRKDLMTLLEVFRLVRMERPGIQLVLAGNKTKRWASDWPSMQRWLAERPDVAADVRVLDYVAEADKLHVYQGAAVNLSTTLWEGFGLTVLEAMACGTPVVTSRAGSLPEIAPGELVGFGTPKDAESYVAPVLEALDGHPPDRAARAREHAATFTWRRTAEGTLAAYRLAAGDLALDLAELRATASS